MNDTVTKLMALADEYMVQERDGTNGFEARQALQEELTRLFTPLTDEQIEKQMGDVAWLDDVDDFRCGVKWAERMHGITGESK